MGNYWYGLGAGWMMLMPVLWIALIGLTIWAVYQLTKGFGRDAAPGPRRESPQEILDRRYASGEIDTATYEEARAHMSEQRQS